MSFHRSSTTIFALLAILPLDTLAQFHSPKPYRQPSLIPKPYECNLEKGLYPFFEPEETCCLNDHLIIDGVAYDQYLWVGVDDDGSPLECPKSKDDICEAIQSSQRFVLPHAGLRRVTEYYGIKVGYYGKFKHSHEPGDVSGGASPTIEVETNDWISDTFASVVAAGNNCCYNVYSNVKPGDRIDTDCTNDLISIDLNWIFVTSFLSPGDVLLSSTQDATTQAALGAGGNLLLSGIGLFVTVATDLDGTPFNGYGLVIGGKFLSFSGGVIRGSSSSWVSEEANETFQLDTVTRDIMSPADVEQFKDSVAASVCALSYQIEALEALATFDVNTGVITCTETSVEDWCVVDITTDDLLATNDFSFVDATSGTDTRVFVRVHGSLAYYEGCFGDTPGLMVFVYVDAHKVTTSLTDACSSYAAISPFIAPVAFVTTMNIEIPDTASPVQGPYVHGRKKSAISAYWRSGTLIGVNPTPEFTAPPAEREVFICDCLCKPDPKDLKIEEIWQCAQDH
eukprot:Selendium_serpulae@DN6271_c1_g1_i2.p1